MFKEIIVVVAVLTAVCYAAPSSPPLNTAHITLYEDINRPKRSGGGKNLIEAARLANEMRQRNEDARRNAEASRNGYQSSQRWTTTTTTTRRPIINQSGGRRW